MPLPALANVQLVILNFVDSDETSEKELRRACKEDLVDQVEMLLQKPHDPNGRGQMGLQSTHSHRSWGWPLGSGAIADRSHG